MAFKEIAQLTLTQGSAVVSVGSGELLTDIVRGDYLEILGALAKQVVSADNTARTITLSSVWVPANAVNVAAIIRPTSADFRASVKEVASLSLLATQSINQWDALANTVTTVTITLPDESTVLIPSIPKAIQDASSLQSNAQAAIDLMGDAPALAQQVADDAAEVVTNLGLTNDAAAATAADVVTTNANVVTTNANVTLTSEDVLAADAAAGQAIQNANATAADKVATNADAQQAAADRVQTGLDATATAEDRVATGLDVEATNADRVITNANVVATNADVVTTANSAAISTANANFYGAWLDQTGAANVPYSVVHADNIWILVNDLANVTTSEPGVSADWISIGTTGDTAPNALKLGGETAIQWDSKINAKVPQTRTIAGKALTSNITLGLGDVTNLQTTLNTIQDTAEFAELMALAGI